MDSIGEKASNQTEDIVFLLDEIITNILERLPPKTVARCRLVCRGWNDLTSSRHFVDRIFRNSIPTILVLVTDPRCYSRLNLYVRDNWWEPVENKPSICRFPSYYGKFPNTSRALFSHAGLIVFEQSECSETLDTNFIILNPARLRRESVTITLSKKLWKSEIYGVYFHPFLKEYCSLWKIDASDNLLEEQITYTILSLGSKPFLRTVSNPFSDKAKTHYVSPIFINNCLYWLLDSLQVSGRKDIMEFNIITEEFTIIPCPVPLLIKCRNYQTRLANIDGILSFFLIFTSIMGIWRLEDHTKRLWKRVTKCTLSVNLRLGTEARGEIAIVDGMLALLSKKRLLVCNLVDGVQNYQKKYIDNVLLYSHQMSLASLNNCKHRINIYLDDKVLVAA